jgi:flagellar protein FliL
MAEENAEESQKEGGGAGKNNMILLIVIGVLVLFLIIGAILAIVMMGEEETMDSVSTETGANATQKATKRTRTHTDLVSVGPMHPLDQFIVNLLSQSGRRYLKTTMNLELDTEALVAELTNKEAVIRDIIIGVLSAKTIEEISTLKGKRKVKDELMVKVNEILVDGQIHNIFFTDFVIQ